jgi:hypothetical protein
MPKTEIDMTHEINKGMGQELVVGILEQSVKDYRLLRQRKMIEGGKINLVRLAKFGKKHIGGMGVKDIRETYRFIHGDDFRREWELGDFEADCERARKQIIEGPINPDATEKKEGAT